ncbi:hypothetical protein MVES1_002210 [Malassezia vespertilionis]|uniref:uncharacterized protein n=1 Tax=Malassezia vespertilionis TaxID=2020962 RepID=UPI0024B03EE1|nr:uncharacterized protein MVES1_002210 [Malassezia vespertilionis]WFD06855.1 hypothetical protein MVES1_002210 [Malassezia vespertilionis]
MAGMARKESAGSIPEASLPEMIDELNSVLVPDEEIARVHDYAEKKRLAQERRVAERKKMQDTLDQLEASVSELRNSSTRVSADWRSLDEHTDIMKGMENEKFDLAKKINEQEAALSMLESEIEEMRCEGDAVEAWDIEEEVGMDRNALSLQLFRGMGFIPYQDTADPEAPITSLLVRSAKRNAAVSIDIDPASLRDNDMTPFTLAEKLWAAAE